MFLLTNGHFVHMHNLCGWLMVLCMKLFILNEWFLV